MADTSSRSRRGATGPTSLTASLQGARRCPAGSRRRPGVQVVSAAEAAARTGLGLDAHTALRAARGCGAAAGDGVLLSLLAGEAAVFCPDPAFVLRRD